MSEQQVIAPLDFARNRNRLRGKIAVADLTRLKDVIASSAGELVYDISGGSTELHRPVLECVIQGSLALKCQRCLDQMEWPVDITSRLVLAQDEDEAERFSAQDDTDESDVIVAEKSMSIADLVEEEVLLDIPMFPAHDYPCTGEESGGTGRKKETPFAALASLKRPKG